MTDVIVIGSGLFGQIITAKLRKDGHEVAMVDSHRPNAGSKPAACLMKPSWFSSLGKRVYTPSLELLDDLYGVQDVEFKVVGASTTVHWIDPATILCETPIHMHVDKVGPGEIMVSGGAAYPDLAPEAPYFNATTIIVAAGVWSSELVPVPGLRGLAGSAFRWPGAKIKEPFINPWAPYKQIVAFNRGDGAWVGDGSAIKQENWDEMRSHQAGRRCANAVGLPLPGALELHGIRPYVPRVKPCYLTFEPGLVVATGGAKNGTIAAGWCAHKISEALK